MNIINTKVKHKTFGMGIVSAFDGKHLSVQFSSKFCKFVYPDAFEKFLEAESAEIQQAIRDDITAQKQAEEVKRLADIAANNAKEESKSVDAAAKQSTITRKKAGKPAIHMQRMDGIPMTFFVFQGNTFDKEFQGGYIWAPKANKAGNRPHHWTRLLDIRKGDIIFHGCDGYIKAISVTRDACYDCPQPVELTVEELWEREGRRVDCDYTELRIPIKTNVFADDIIRLCQAKYAPFDKTGNGNMGYLFELNGELARIFTRASVEKNRYLARLDFINELLLEENND